MVMNLSETDYKTVNRPLADQDKPSLTESEALTEPEMLTEPLSLTGPEAQRFNLHAQLIKRQLQKLQKIDDQIDLLQSEMLRYLCLGLIRLRSLPEQTLNTTALEIKVDTNLQISCTMHYFFKELGEKLSTAVDASIKAIGEADYQAVTNLLMKKNDIEQLINQALELQSRALAELGHEHIEVIRMQLGVLENLKRIHVYHKRIARKFAPEDVIP